MFINKLSEITKTLTKEDYDYSFKNIKKSSNEYYKVHNYSWHFDKKGGVLWHTSFDSIFPNPAIIFDDKYIDWLEKNENIYNDMILFSIKYSLRNSIREAKVTKQYEYLKDSYISEHYNEIKIRVKKLCTADRHLRIMNWIQDNIDSVICLNGEGMINLFLALIHDFNCGKRNEIIDALINEDRNSFWISAIRELSGFDGYEEKISSLIKPEHTLYQKVLIGAFSKFHNWNSVEHLFDLIKNVRRDIEEANVQESLAIKKFPNLNQSFNLLKEIFDDGKVTNSILNKHDDKLKEIDKIRDGFSNLFMEFNSNLKFATLNAIETRTEHHEKYINYFSRLGLIRGKILFENQDKVINAKIEKDSLFSFFSQDKEIENLTKSLEFEILKDDLGLTKMEISKFYYQIDNYLSISLNGKIENYATDNLTLYAMTMYATKENFDYEELDDFISKIDDKFIVEKLLDEGVFKLAEKNDISTFEYKHGQSRRKSENKIITQLMDNKLINRNLAFWIKFLIGEMGFNVKNNLSHNRKPVNIIAKKLFILIMVDMNTIIDEVEIDEEPLFWLMKDFKGIDFADLIQTEIRSCKIDNKGNKYDCGDWKKIDSPSWVVK